MALSLRQIIFPQTIAADSIVIIGSFPVILETHSETRPATRKTGDRPTPVLVGWPSKLPTICTISA
jgi:hypothetical protein